MQSPVERQDHGVALLGSLRIFLLHLAGRFGCHTFFTIRAAQVVLRVLLDAEFTDLVGDLIAILLFGGVLIGVNGRSAPDDVRGKGAARIFTIGDDLYIGALVGIAVLLDNGGRCGAHILREGIGGHSVGKQDCHHPVPHGGELVGVLGRVAVQPKFFHHGVVTVLCRGVIVQIQVVLALHGLDIRFTVRGKGYGAISAEHERQVVDPCLAAGFEQLDQRQNDVVLRLVVVCGEIGGVQDNGVPLPVGDDRIAVAVQDLTACGLHIHIPNGYKITLCGVLGAVNDL